MINLLSMFDYAFIDTEEFCLLLLLEIEDTKERRDLNERLDACCAFFFLLNFSEPLI